VLGEAGLHWEFACQPCAIPSVSKVAQDFPEMKFVLNHLGHNAGIFPSGRTQRCSLDIVFSYLNDDMLGGEDFGTWSVALSELSQHPNVVLKLGAIEVAINTTMTTRPIGCLIQTLDGRNGPFRTLGYSWIMP